MDAAAAAPAMGGGMSSEYVTLAGLGRGGDLHRNKIIRAYTV